MRTEVMLWKFARERAFTAGSASKNERVFRRIFKSVAFNTRREMLKKRIWSGCGDLGVGKVDR
jgi:hypothetical protein